MYTLCFIRLLCERPPVYSAPDVTIVTDVRFATRRAVRRFPTYSTSPRGVVASPRYAVSGILILPFWGPWPGSRHIRLDGSEVGGVVNWCGLRGGDLARYELENNPFGVFFLHLGSGLR